MRYDFPIGDIAELWRRGQRGRIVAARSHGRTRWPKTRRSRDTPATSKTRARAAGRCMAAIEESVPADVLTASLYTRFRSRQDHTFAEKVLSAMRKNFGGHVEPGGAQK